MALQTSVMKDESYASVSIRSTVGSSVFPSPIANFGASEIVGRDSTAEFASDKARFSRRLKFSHGSAW